jgi:hypothetical protein
MDLLTAILTCSLYFGDDDLVRAMAESASHSNPYYVLDASVDLTQVDPPPLPKNASEAAARTTDILASGGRPLVGLLQLPPAWMTAFRRDLADAFDSCTNIAVGTAMLSQFDFECTRAGSAKGPLRPRDAKIGAASRRRCVLRKYEEAIGSSDFAAAAALELRYQRPAHPAVESAPIFAAPTDRQEQQLLFPPSPLIGSLRP